MRYLVLVASACCLLTGCHVLSPQPILPGCSNLPDSLLAEGEPQIEQGAPLPVIDCAGWIWGIPGKVLLWNCRVENHRISPETAGVLAGYLAANELDEVKVRLNQYHPLDDWRRLRRNTSVAWPLRYSVGTISVLGETLIPGRVFGADHYNPFTATIHLYSDLPSIALHEGAHAKDFARRKYPGLYAVAYLVPGVPLFHERIATRDVMAYVEDQHDPQLIREAYHVLYPAYGTYVGDALGHCFPGLAGPFYLAGVLGGHAAGRVLASQRGTIPTAHEITAEEEGEGADGEAVIRSVEDRFSAPDPQRGHR